MDVREVLLFIMDLPTHLALVMWVAVKLWIPAFKLDSFLAFIDWVKTIGATLWVLKMTSFVVNCY